MEVSSIQTELQLPIVAGDMLAGENVIRDVTVENVGIEDFQYKVGFEKVSGDDDLCNGLQVAINDGISDIHSGALSSLDYKFLSTLTSGSIEDYVLKISLPLGASEDLEELACGFNLVFTAWQTDFIAPIKGWIDEERLENNEINSGEWFSEGDVIINEIMWMGSDGETSDEWIELKNMTDSNINLSNWNIHGLGSGSGSGAHLEIPSGYSIKANGYFLILRKKWNETAVSLSDDLDKDEGMTNKSNMSIHNSGEELILKSKLGETIDTAWKNAAWPAGENGVENRSMQRKPVPGDGTEASSWFTVNHPDANDLDYWVAEINNYGTPGEKNLLPVVLNEFVANPSGSDDDVMPGGEWIELWNNDSETWDVDGWIIANENGDEIVISNANSDNDGDTSDGGETIILPGDDLVVYVDGQFAPSDFFDNDSDGKLYLYAKYGDLEIDNDHLDYLDPSEFATDKAYQRIPNGIGPWTDPDPRPGEENELNRDEKDYYLEIVLEECFDDKNFDRESEYPLCKGIFLEYLGLLDDQYDDEMDEDVYEEILEVDDAETTASQKEEESEEIIFEKEPVVEEDAVAKPGIVVEDENNLETEETPQTTEEEIEQSAYWSAGEQGTENNEPAFAEAMMGEVVDAEVVVLPEEEIEIDQLEDEDEEEKEEETKEKLIEEEEGEKEVVEEEAKEEEG